MFSKADLLDQRDHVIASHPRTRFVAAHVAESSENLQRAAQLLDTCPNASIDISARASELGRQPFSARRFFLKYADRILFGSDLLPEESMYSLYYRFLETDDEYFEYPSHASRQAGGISTDFIYRTTCCGRSIARMRCAFYLSAVPSHVNQLLRPRSWYTRCGVNCPHGCGARDGGYPGPGPTFAFSLVGCLAGTAGGQWYTRPSSTHWEFVCPLNCDPAHSG